MARRAGAGPAPLSVDELILERAYGERGGVGWIGKSTMLINQAWDLWLAAVLFTSPRRPARGAPDRCGRCDDCEQGCPTGALEGRRLDARRCVATGPSSTAAGSLLAPCLTGGLGL